VCISLLQLLNATRRVQRQEYSGVLLNPFTPFFSLPFVWWRHTSTLRFDALIFRSDKSLTTPSFGVLSARRQHSNQHRRTISIHLLLSFSIAFLCGFLASRDKRINVFDRRCSCVVTTTSSSRFRGSCAFLLLRRLPELHRVLVRSLGSRVRPLRFHVHARRAQRRRRAPIR